MKNLNLIKLIFSFMCAAKIIIINNYNAPTPPVEGGDSFNAILSGWHQGECNLQKFETWQHGAY